MKWLLCLLFCANSFAAILIKEDPNLPITYVNFTFQVGSARDPQGKEGMSYLLARWLREGGLRAWKERPARSRAEIEEFLFPYGIDISVQVAKEQITFRTASPKVNADEALLMVAQMLLAPGWDSQALTRIKGETREFLTKQAPLVDEEEMGKMALEVSMYGKGHPYSHAVEGSLAGVASATPNEIQAFYDNQIRRSTLTLGISGAITPKLKKTANDIHNLFKKGLIKRKKISVATLPMEKELLMVSGPYDAVGVHAGHPITITRTDADFPALYLGTIAFGKHRSFVGRLMKQVREVRGLNYGTYAYIEEFPRGGQLLQEPTQVARTQQSFTVWARPTPLENGCFLLKQVAYEVDRWVKQGITKDEFAMTQGHLLGSLPSLITSNDRFLEYLIDGQFYGIPGNDPIARLRANVAKVKLDEVNAAIKKHIRPDKLLYVVASPDTEAVLTQLKNGKCEIHYASGVVPSDAQKAEDTKISTFPLLFGETKVSTVTSTSFY